MFRKLFIQRIGFRVRGSGFRKNFVANLVANFVDSKPLRLNLSILSKNLRHSVALCG
jgi:hypothetical protein